MQHLASERDRLAGILETMAEGVLLTDPRGKIALANASLRSMVGASGQLIGKEPIEAIRNDELAEMIASVAKYAKAGHRRSRPRSASCRGACSFELRRSPCAEIKAWWRCSRMSPICVVSRSLRRDFVANVSHELRTPIAAIRAAAETLEGGADRRPTAARDFIAA